MEKVLDQLVGKLQKAYQERLVSVVLYGSRAVGDAQGQFSDYNILCILSQVSTRELAEATPVFHWWRQLGNPAPLLLSEDEVRTSTDCFTIEFRDIKERHTVLLGEDLVAGLEIDYSFYRSQVERELRSKVLRLRQKAGGLLSDKDLLRRLLIDSFSTFCVLCRHALLLMGVEAKYEKGEIVEQARLQFGIDPTPFQTLLELREQRIKPKTVDPVPLFEEYMKQIQVVVDAVDRLEK